MKPAKSIVKILIGHRGVGKTSLLKRLQNYFPDNYFSDLDQIIHENEGTIESIFTDFGEDHFRKFELNYFQKYLDNIAQHPIGIHWISLGAGFQLNKIKDILKTHQNLLNFEFIWVSRSTDQEGRMFLNRPLLNSNLDPLQDFLLRKLDRDQSYSSFADWTYHVPEGFENFSENEKALFENSFHHIQGVITLIPEHKKSSMTWSCFLKRFLKNPEIIFEIRNDIWNQEQIQILIHELPVDRVLFSIRKEIPNEEFFKINFWKFDWAMELGEPSKNFLSLPEHKQIISFHESNVIESNKGLFTNLSSQQIHFKVSPVINTWEELEFWYQWQRQDPEFRSFHPRSLNGRWKWFRLLQWSNQKINFIKDFSGSALDQPSLIVVLQLPRHISNFAGVVGSPIQHSRSPQEQHEYFFQLQRPFLSIQIEKSEFNAAIEILKKMGLDHVAVTSPLKELAFKLAASHSKEAHQLKSVNTLVLDTNKSQWNGHNTDLSGFEFQMKHLLKQLPIHPQIAVWGGGGTLEVIRNVLPNAVFYSSTRGTPRDSEVEIQNPICVIWAAPNSDKMTWPPENWQPQMVVDLNYIENSFGIKYAMKAHCQYSSGLAMFKKQAQEQQKYWSEQHVSK